MSKYLCLVPCFICILVLCPYTNVSAQNADHNFTPTFKNGISKPNTLATHPFGILFYTLPHNFKKQPHKVPLLDINLSSGNIWGQPVGVHVPTSTNDRSRLKPIPFYNRQFSYDTTQSPSEIYWFQYDGILKDLRLAYSFPINLRQEVQISTRSFMLTKGKLPFSVITGDQFIEFFHSNIAGGEDPFGRRERGMDQALIRYTDRNDNTMGISSGTFVFSGIETAYHYYPSIFEKHKVSLNLGAHAGINLSPYNSSLDIGLSVAGVKELNSKPNHLFLLGLGLNVLRKRAIGFRGQQVDLGTNSLFGSFEGHMEYSKKTVSGGWHSFGLNYRIQTPYNNKKEEGYYVPFSPDKRIARWHEAARHLYKFPSYWSLIYSFTKKTEISFYLQQDMLVNNTPDLQLGASLKIPISF